MASAEEAASIRISFADSEENTVMPVADFHTTETGSAAKLYPADQDALALPRMPATNMWVQGGSKIVLSAMSDAADTVESEESNGSFGIILKHVTSGAVRHVKLRVGDAGRADFSGFNSTSDVALITGVYRRLGAYTVPDGYHATLDAGTPVHCYLGDDTA